MWIKAIRGFVAEGGAAVAKYAIVELPDALACELIASNKAEATSAPKPKRARRKIEED